MMGLRRLFDRELRARLKVYNQAISNLKALIHLLTVEYDSYRCACYKSGDDPDNQPSNGAYLDQLIQLNRGLSLVQAERDALEGGGR